MIARSLTPRKTMTPYSRGSIILGLRDRADLAAGTGTVHRRSTDYRPAPQCPARHPRTAKQPTVQAAANFPTDRTVTEFFFRGRDVSVDNVPGSPRLFLHV
jgi:hypothetical protein